VIRIAVVGATGYTGAELISIFAGHPSARVVGLFSSGRSDPVASIAELFPRLRGIAGGELPVASFSEPALDALAPDVVFLATPVEVSHELAPKLVAKGMVVIDLSPAFRLTDAAAFEKTYGFRHGNPALQKNSAYGLPEWNRDAIARADLIACPGCYATSAILPLRALREAGLLAPGSRPIVDAVSGVSGAGRAATARTHFCEVSLQPYNALKHRHAPEIAEHAGIATHFVPHLAPWDRGILATIHAELAPGASLASARSAFDHAYADAPFVRILPSGQWPSINPVVRTNFCDLGLDADGSHLVVVSAIDNLVKGASGQAVQCMNIRFGFAETAGLIPDGAREGVVA